MGSLGHHLISPHHAHMVQIYLIIINSHFHYFATLNSFLFNYISILSLFFLCMWVNLMFLSQLFSISTKKKKEIDFFISN